MKFLFRLFKAKSKETPATPSPVEQKATLDSLPQESLAQRASDSSDADLQREAVIRLDYGQVLKQLAFHSAESSVIQRIARKRVAELLESEKLSLATLRDDCSDSQALLGTLGFCREDKYVLEVLSEETRESELTAMASRVDSAKVRKAIAERVSAAEYLKPLARDMKSKDKTAYRIVKEKLDVLREAEREQHAFDMEVADICEALELHAKRVVDNRYAARLQVIVDRWEKLNRVVNEGFKARYDYAVKACQALLDEQKEKLEAEALTETALKNLPDDRKRVLSDIAGLYAELFDAEVLDETHSTAFSGRLIALKSNWEKLKLLDVSRETEKQVYLPLCEAFESSLKFFASHGTLVQQLKALSDVPQAEWAREHSQQLQRYLRQAHYLEEQSPSSVVTDAKALKANIDAHLNEAEEKRKNTLRQIGGLIRRGVSAAEAGRIRQAVGFRHSVREKVEELGEQNLPRSLKTKVEALEESVEKLIDWQRYAVVPKKEELISAMEALTQVELAPETLATKIKQLQNDWKSLKQSGEDRQEDLWVRFNEAAQRAYEPCKAHFQQLSNLRAENLGKRKALIQQLEQYLALNDWENADWSQVEKTLRIARQEWHSYSPVERSALTGIQTAFDAVNDGIRHHLTAEFDKNRRAKEALVVQAEGLLTNSADIGEAIDKAKQLQGQWKQIGRCSRKDSDRLWKTFRGHCDAVFEKRSQEYEAKTQELNHTLEMADQIIAALGQIADKSGKALLDARADQERLTDEFQALGELPRGKKANVFRSYEKVMKSIESKLASERLARKEEGWTTFFDLVGQLNHYRFRRIVQDTQDEATPDAALLAERCGNFDHWPDGVQTLYQEAFDASSEDVEGNTQGNESDVRRLCVRSEILVDRSSPTEDQALRMKLQVEMLQAGWIQKDAHSLRTEKYALLKQWLALAPVNPDIYRAYVERFAACWKS